jgi:hypothetical protein
MKKIIAIVCVFTCFTGALQAQSNAHKHIEELFSAAFFDFQLIKGELIDEDEYSANYKVKNALFSTEQLSIDKDKEATTVITIYMDKKYLDAYPILVKQKEELLEGVNSFFNEKAKDKENYTVKNYETERTTKGGKTFKIKMLELVNSRGIVIMELLQTADGEKCQFKVYTSAVFKKKD